MRCPATTRIDTWPGMWSYTPVKVGAQCKFERGHEGPHAVTRYEGRTDDHFWTDADEIKRWASTDEVWPSEQVSA